MRVDPNFIANLVPAIDRSSAREDTLTQELSSGLRVGSLADDPLAVAQSLTLGSAISRADTFVQNAAREQSLLQVTDSALGDAVGQVTSAIALTVRASSGTLNAADRATIAAQLTSIRDHVLSVANSTYQGQYVFGGSQNGARPFTLDTSVTPAVAVYTGDAGVRSIQTPNGQQIALNLPGGAVFTAAGGDLLGTLNKLVADFSGSSPSQAADGGALSTALSVLTQQRSLVGNSLSALEANSTAVQTQSTQYKARQSELVSADTAQVATDLRTAEIQHQALLSVIGTLSKGSLFDYLR